MPQVAVAVAGWVSSAIVAVSAPILGVAAAGTIGGAVFTGIASLGGAFGLASAIGAWATVASISSLASRPKIGSGGGQVPLKLDPNAPIPVVLGRSATGGYLIYRSGFEAKNKQLGLISCLSTGPVQAIESFLANDVPVNFSGVYPTASGGQWSGKMRQWRRLGDQSESAYSVNPPYSAALPGWTSAHMTTGYATALWVNEYDAKAFPTGLPRGLWIVQGEKFYDPRKDSTFPGGLGSHRLNDPLTWQWTQNPYIMALGWILGRYHNGKKVWGLGIASGGIDWAAFIDGANIADANSWTAGGVVTTADSKLDVLVEILRAGAGYPVARGGQFSCLVSAPKAVVYAITASDIIGDISIQTSQSRRERINTVIPTYRSEANRWQMVQAASVSAASYVLADSNEVRTKEQVYGLCQNVNQAAQLAAYDLVDARENLIINLVAKPRLLNVRVGEAVTITVEELGLSGQKCIVLSRAFDPNSLQVSLTLRSETDAKHAFALGKTGVAPPAPSLGAYDPSSMAAPGAGAWASIGGTVTNGTSSLPAVIVTGAVDDPNALHVIIEYRPSSSPVYRLWAEGPVATTRVEITGLAAGTAYIVAVSYRSVRGVVGARLELGAVVTGGLGVDQIGGLGPGDINNALVVPAAVNRLRYSRWEAGVLTGWAVYDPTARNPTLTNFWPNGYLGRYPARLGGTASAANQAVVLFTAPAFRFAVKAGERLSVQALVEAQNGAGQVELTFYDASGASLGTLAAFSVAANSSFGTQGQGFVTVPANAVAAAFAFNIYTLGAGAFVFSLAQPMVSAATASQTAHPAWVAGSDAAAGADVTGQNIAAGFSGQGALATQSQVTTTFLATGAASAVVAVEATNNTTISTSTESTATQLTHTSSGGKFILHAYALCQVPFGNNLGLTLLLYRNGILINTASDLLINGFSSGTSAIFYDFPAIGTHVYTLKALGSANSNTGAQLLTSRLYSMELRQAG